MLLRWVGDAQNFSNDSSLTSFENLETFFPGSKSHVFNVGAPVWGLDWCPIHPDDRPGIQPDYMR